VKERKERKRKREERTRERRKRSEERKRERARGVKRERARGVKREREKEIERKSERKSERVKVQERKRKRETLSSYLFKREKGINAGFIFILNYWTCNYFCVKIFNVIFVIYLYLFDEITLLSPHLSAVCANKTYVSDCFLLLSRAVISYQKRYIPFSVSSSCICICRGILEVELHIYLFFS
jgi:hypothetical protein